MEAVSFEAKKRENLGKGASRKDRSAGFLPVNLYGIEKTAQSLLISGREFKNRFKDSVAYNPLVSLKISGSMSEDRLAIVKEVQKHPLSRNLLHVDLYEVSKEKRVEVLVALEFKGVPRGVKQEGGTLSIQRKRVKLRCFPLEIPESLSVDLAPLKAGEKILVKDISCESGMEFADNPDVTVAIVKRPRGGELREAGAEGEGEVK